MDTFFFYTIYVVIDACDLVSHIYAVKNNNIKYVSGWCKAEYTFKSGVVAHYKHLNMCTYCNRTKNYEVNHIVYFLFCRTFSICKRLIQFILNIFLSIPYHVI